MFEKIEPTGRSPDCAAGSTLSYTLVQRLTNGQSSVGRKLTADTRF